MSLPGPSNHGPSLDGLRRVLAADQTFARVRAEAARGFAVRVTTAASQWASSVRSISAASLSSRIATQATVRRPAATSGSASASAAIPPGLWAPST